jgi:hypothetical protein
MLQFESIMKSLTVEARCDEAFLGRFNLSATGALHKPLDQKLMCSPKPKISTHQAYQFYFSKFTVINKYYKISLSFLVYVPSSSHIS